MKKSVIGLVLFCSLITYAQEFKLTVDEKTGKPMLLGITNREALQDTNFGWWYNSEYDFYRVDTVSLSELTELPEDIKIKVVYATWCSDSRREVPRFFKILDYLNFPLNRTELIAVDRKKKGLGNEAENLNIELVPTMIFYKEGKEIGRIIEVPEESLELDLVNIIKSK